MLKRSFIAHLQVVCVTAIAASTATQSHANDVNISQIEQANRQAIERTNRQALQENQRRINKQLQPKPSQSVDTPEVKEVEAEGNPVLKETHQCLPISGVYITEASLLSHKEFEKQTPINDRDSKMKIQWQLDWKSDHCVVLNKCAANVTRLHSTGWQ